MLVNDIVSFEHQVSLAQDARITAYYGSVIAGQLEAFARCQDYPRHVADSILLGGPLVGLLELRMRERKRNGIFRLRAAVNSSVIVKRKTCGRHIYT